MRTISPRNAAQAGVAKAANVTQNDNDSHLHNCVVKAVPADQPRASGPVEVKV